MVVGNKDGGNKVQEMITIILASLLTPIFFRASRNKAVHIPLINETQNNAVEEKAFRAKEFRY